MAGPPGCATIVPEHQRHGRAPGAGHAGPEPASPVGPEGRSDRRPVPRRAEGVEVRRVQYARTTGADERSASTAAPIAHLGRDSRPGRPGATSSGEVREPTRRSQRRFGPGAAPVDGRGRAFGRRPGGASRSETRERAESSERANHSARSSVRPEAGRRQPQRDTRASGVASARAQRACGRSSVGRRPGAARRSETRERARVFESERATQSGMLPCLRRGSSSRFERSIARPATIFWRVSAGSITSST